MSRTHGQVLTYLAFIYFFQIYTQDCPKILMYNTFVFFSIGYVHANVLLYGDVAGSLTNNPSSARVITDRFLRFMHGLSLQSTVFGVPIWRQDPGTHTFCAILFC